MSNISSTFVNKAYWLDRLTRVRRISHVNQTHC